LRSVNNRFRSKTLTGDPGSDMLIGRNSRAQLQRWRRKDNIKMDPKEIGFENVD